MLKTTVDITNTLEEILSTKKYGDLLSYEYLERSLETERYEMDFAVKMAKLKNALIECGYVLSCILNEGYRILMPNEIADEVLNKYVKGSLKKIGKGIMIMQCTDVSTLTEAELNAFGTLQNALAIMYKDNENHILNAQAVLSAVKKQEIEGK